MKKYDVIIVGAGPAGSTAAYFLARTGAKVCLVDKQTFPRDKVCGDGVNSFTLAGLERMGLSQWLEQNSFNAPGEFLLSAPNGQAVRILPDDRSFCYGRVIPRLKLDKAILDQAVKAGADLLEGVKLGQMTRPVAGAIRLSGLQKAYRANLQLESKLLITADGAHASFTKYLGLVKKQPDMVAVRAYFENVGGRQSLLEIHYDPTIMPGYGWIFPMSKGQANVGLGTYVSRSRQRDVNLKQALQQFIRNNRYAKERLAHAQQIGSLKGYPLRSQINSVTPFANNILVAGEAAGLVNPINGEGIGPAIISGELAAQHAKVALEVGDFSTSQLNSYAKDLQKYIGRHHFVARILCKLLVWPGVMNRTIQRAQHDHDFAQTLFNVIMELKPPVAFLSPIFVAKFIAGGSRN